MKLNSLLKLKPVKRKNDGSAQRMLLIFSPFEKVEKEFAVGDKIAFEKKR
jgi:hypothetical protein